MKKMTWLIRICMVAALSFPVANTVFAKGNIRFGKVKVTPKIGANAEYNDNIFLDNGNEKDDYIFKLRPGVGFDYSGSRGNYLRAGYDLELGTYLDYDDNNYHSHNPYVSGAMRTSSGFYFKADDRFTYSSDSYGSENLYNQGVKTKRWNNTAGFTLGWDFAERYSVEAMYENYLIRYMEDQDKWQNRIDHKIGASLFFRLTHKTSLFAEFRHTMAEYDEQNDGTGYWDSGNSEDYKLYDYFLGVRFEPGQKLIGNFKFGYGQKDFENEYSPMLDTQGQPRRYEDQTSFITTWIAETSVEYRPVHRTRINFVVNRSYMGSPDYYSSSYIDTMIDLSVKQGVGAGDRFWLKAGVKWNRNDYADEDPGQPSRYFNIYTVNAAMEWQIQKWLAAGLGYQYASKSASDSLYEEEEYNNSIIEMYMNAEL